MTNQISSNLNKVRNNIAIFAKKYNRKLSDINLIAVSKTILQDKIEDAIKSGCRNFGENRIEESLEKWPDLKNKYPQTNLHLIGHLQSKKAKKAITIFDYILTYFKNIFIHTWITPCATYFKFIYCIKHISRKCFFKFI